MPQPNRLRILIVDDSADTCEAFSRLMAHDGHIVFCAGTFADARIACEWEPFDVTPKDREPLPAVRRPGVL